MKDDAISKTELETKFRYMCVRECDCCPWNVHVPDDHDYCALIRKAPALALEGIVPTNEGYGTCLRVKDINEWDSRIILLEEGSKNCAVYYADAEEEPAEWVKAQGMMPPEYTGRHVCSRCGKFALSNKWGREELSDHCPACGKKMGGKAE